MDKIKNFFSNNDKFAKHCGIDIIDISEGTATTEMVIRDFHLNGNNTVHGGALFTLADYTFAIACNSYGTVAVALNAQISFIRPGIKGKLTAKASEISCGSKTANYQIDIFDENNKLISKFNGTAFRKNEKIKL